jgi:hypothetical protein
MVNIFGMKLFESPSMEEQMHYKGRHGPNCECPNCLKKKYRGRHGHNCGCPNCGKKRHSSRRRFISRRRLRGGYTYKQNNKSMKEEDVTMELSNVLSGSKSRSKSMSKSKAKASARGTRRQRH